MCSELSNRVVGSVSVRLEAASIEHRSFALSENTARWLDSFSSLASGIPLGLIYVKKKMRQWPSPAAWALPGFAGESACHPGQWTGACWDSKRFASPNSPLKCQAFCWGRKLLVALNVPFLFITNECHQSMKNVDLERAQPGWECCWPLWRRVKCLSCEPNSLNRPAPPVKGNRCAAQPWREEIHGPSAGECRPWGPRVRFVKNMVSLRTSDVYI